MKKQTPVLDAKRLERLERRRATRKMRYSSYREIHEGKKRQSLLKRVQSALRVISGNKKQHL